MKRRSSLLAPAVFFIVTLCLGACSNQGEGERCDTANGNDDCSSGLICQHIEGQQSDVQLCCPRDPAQATVPECVPGAKVQDGGSADAQTDAASDQGSSEAQASETSTDTDSSSEQ